MNKIRLVSASRFDNDDFKSNALLAKSLSSYCPINVEPIIYTNNSLSLSEIYNNEIEKSENDPAILVFVHDDVMLLDYYWPIRVQEGLEKFDVIGVAGNKRRLPYQPGWGHKGFSNNTFVWEDDEFLSGLVAHDDTWPPKIMTHYGPTNQKVVQLDGVFLAAKSDTLLRNNIRFDQNFTFHFYDLDFSRTCEQKGLSMGTVPLAICHGGKGNMNNPEYIKMYNVYNQKWENK